MAYCVHCGVKLGEAEPRCPLCGTEAVDPACPQNPGAERAYPVRTPEQTLRIHRGYAVSALSFLLLLPAGLCLLLDVLGGQGIGWSVYPAGILVLSWIAVTVPLLMRRNRLYSTILVTGATLAGYLYMVERMSRAPGWFFPIVLPALLLFIAMVCLTIALRRKWKMRVMRIVAFALAEAGALSLAVELLIERSAGGGAFYWSPFVAVPCCFVALLLYVITKNRPLYDELRRRLHF